MSVSRAESEQQRILDFWWMLELFSPHGVPTLTSRATRPADRQVSEWKPGRPLRQGFIDRLGERGMVIPDRDRARRYLRHIGYYRLSPYTIPFQKSRKLPNLGIMVLMAQNTSISLDGHFSEFLTREVSSGRFRSASEVVRAGLRLLEDQETQLAALRAALVVGEASGEPEPFDFDAFIAMKRP